MLGWMQLANGEAAQAIKILRPLVHNFGLAPFPGWPSLALWLLAEAQLGTGAHEDAAASLEQAASIARTAALTWVLGRAALVRAKLLAREGDWLGSESLVHQALSQGGDAGDRLGLVDAVEFLAELVIEQGSVKQGVRLLAAAQSHREHLGYSRFPASQAHHVAAIARARESLDPADFAAGWAEGAELSAEEAIAYAARGRGERKRPTRGWESLTPSELQVVRLVGEHLSNPEVAKRLFISRATVKSHLVHIFSKLGIDSRSELAAQAAKRGLVRRPE